MLHHIHRVYDRELEFITAASPAWFLFCTGSSESSGHEREVENRSTTANAASVHHPGHFRGYQGAENKRIQRISRCSHVRAEAEGAAVAGAASGTR